jgi:hypothetical protein
MANMEMMIATFWNAYTILKTPSESKTKFGLWLMNFQNSKGVNFKTQKNQDVLSCLGWFYAAKEFDKAFRKRPFASSRRWLIYQQMNNYQNKIKTSKRKLNFILKFSSIKQINI